MLKDIRANRKLREFFHRLARDGKAEDISKDTTAFPDSVMCAFGFAHFLDVFIETSSERHVRLSAVVLADYLFLRGGWRDSMA